MSSNENDSELISSVKALEICKEKFKLITQPITLYEKGLHIIFAPDYSEIYDLIHSRDASKALRAFFLNKLFNEYDFPIVLLPAWAWEFIHYEYKVWARMKYHGKSHGREKLFFDDPNISNFYNSFKRGDIKTALECYERGAWKDFVRLINFSGLKELFNEPIKRFFRYIESGRLKSLDEIEELGDEKIEIDEEIYGNLFNVLKKSDISRQMKEINNQVDAHSGALAFSLDKKAHDHKCFFYVITQSKYPIRAFNSIPIKSDYGSFNMAMTPLTMEYFNRALSLDLSGTSSESKVQFIKRGMELTDNIIRNLNEVDIIGKELTKFKENSNLLTEEFFEKKKFLDEFMNDWTEFTTNYFDKIIKSEIKKDIKEDKIEDSKIEEAEKIFGTLIDEKKFIEGVHLAQNEIQNRIIESIENLNKFMILKKPYEIDSFKIKEKLDEIKKVVKKDDLV